MCGQHNVRTSAGDSTGENTDKGHTPNPKIGIKIPDPAGNRTRAAGLEGRDSADLATETNYCRIEREKFYPGPGLELRPLAFRASALTNRAIQDKYGPMIESSFFSYPFWSQNLYNNTFPLKNEQI